MSKKESRQFDFSGEPRTVPGDPLEPPNKRNNIMHENTTTQSTVCRLISAAMFGNDPEYPADVDWAAVHAEMCDQAVQGLVMDILPSLPVPEDLKKTWSNECLQVMTNGLRLRAEQEDFLRILEAAEIPYVILKGTAAAMYYPNPFLRGMGDVDIYVPQDFHAKVRKLLTEAGYSEKQGQEHYKRHRNFSKNRTEIEVHRNFATVNGPGEMAYIDGLIEACCRDRRKTERVEQGATTFYAPQTYVNGLVLLEHIGHHMMAGLGLRQVIDWMMFAHTSLHDDAWGDFQMMARAAGLETLAKAATKMCVRYFGLNGSFMWCMDADDAVADEILDYLFASGNFGRKQGKAGKVIAVKNRFDKMNVFSALQTAGEVNWKLYKRHRWLRPFAWIYQIFRYARQILRTREGIRTLRKGTVEANRRARLMEGLRIYR